MTQDTRILLASVVGLVLIASSCQSYTVPGRAADMGLFTRGGELDPVRETDDRASAETPLAEILARQPMAAFPTALAVARVQGSGYRSEANWQAVGSGNYTLISSRDEGEQVTLTELEEWPQVSGIVGLNRLLVPEQLETDVELRKAAAQLHADMVLVYTLDTSLETHNRSVLLTLLSLGIAPTYEARVRTTASAVLLDTRTGYVYGAAEVSTGDEERTSEWNFYWGNDVSEEYRDTEHDAIVKLAGELERTWSGILATYSRSPSGVHAAGG